MPKHSSLALGAGRQITNTRFLRLYCPVWPQSCWTPQQEVGNSTSHCNSCHPPHSATLASIRCDNIAESRPGWFCEDLRGKPRSQTEQLEAGHSSHFCHLNSKSTARLALQPISTQDPKAEWSRQKELQGVLALLRKEELLIFLNNQKWTSFHHWLTMACKLEITGRSFEVVGYREFSLYLVNRQRLCCRQTDFPPTSFFRSLTPQIHLGITTRSASEGPKAGHWVPSRTESIASVLSV